MRATCVLPACKGSGRTGDLVGAFRGLNGDLLRTYRNPNHWDNTKKQSARSRRPPPMFEQGAAPPQTQPSCARSGCRSTALAHTHTLRLKHRRTPSNFGRHRAKCSPILDGLRPRSLGLPPSAKLGGPTSPIPGQTRPTSGQSGRF